MTPARKAAIDEALMELDEAHSWVILTFILSDTNNEDIDTQDADRRLSKVILAVQKLGQALQIK